MRQGQGGSTSRKQMGFAILLRQCLRMTRGLPYPYWHIDLNAGSGFNEKADCVGSPLVFLDEAEKVGKPFNALFCDNDPEAVGNLGAALAASVERFESSTIAVRCRDNAEAVAEFSGWIRDEEPHPEFACGTVLCDPNGYPHGFPVAALSEFAGRFPRIDFILNVNVSLFAMARGCKGKTDKPRAFDQWPDPATVIGLRGCKSHWLVRNPTPGGKGQRFVIFIGRNTGKGMSQFADFFPIDSARGELIVNSLTRVVPGQRFFWE